MPLRMLAVVAAVIALTMAGAACGGDGEDAGDAVNETQETATVATGEMQLTSEAFSDGAAIPATYTCSGEDVSPPLHWDGAPDGTQSFALVVDDPDAPGGTFDHWLVYDIPPDTRELPAGVDLGSRARQGTNSRGNASYMGLCPPPGPAHHYRFRLFALDSELNLDAGASKSDLLDAVEGHVLADTLLTGTFSR